MKNAGHGWHDTTIVASRVQAMASIFHPFVSLCFHYIPDFVRLMLKHTIKFVSATSIEGVAMPLCRGIVN